MAIKLSDLMGSKWHEVGATGEADPRFVDLLMLEASEDLDFFLQKRETKIPDQATMRYTYIVSCSDEHWLDVKKGLHKLDEQYYLGLEFDRW